MDDLTATIGRIFEAEPDIAQLMHQIWARWIDYLFSCAQYHRSGALIIPADKVNRWHRQMITPYRDLPESEQKSDIKIAREVAFFVLGKVRSETAEEIRDATDAVIDTNELMRELGYD